MNVEHMDYSSFIEIANTDYKEMFICARAALWQFERIRS